VPELPLPLPDKPSIAVLPFQNMSGDPEQEYFTDGMVEEIITALSRIRWLFVIARNSSFTYKGQAVDVKRVGRELGVRYVLEGSVRKGGNRRSGSLRCASQPVQAGQAGRSAGDPRRGELDSVESRAWRLGCDRGCRAAAGEERRARHSECREMSARSLCRYG